MGSSTHFFLKFFHNLACNLLHVIKNMKKSLSIIFILLNIFFLQILAQDEYGSMLETDVLENYDTLLTTRTYGNWWFSIIGSGLAFNSYNGQVKNLENPTKDFNEIGNTIKGFKTSNNRLAIGIPNYWIFNVDYIPTDTDWGGQLRLFYDRHSFTSQRVKEIDFGEDINYIIEGEIDYIGINPAVSYRLPYFTGLKAYTGPDLFIPMSAKGSYVDNPDNIENTRTAFDFKDVPIMYGAHLGVEVEFLNIDISKTVRGKTTFFVQADYFLTTALNDFGSDLKTFRIRLGGTFRIGPDIMSYDTLKFDPFANSGRNLAKFETDESILFDGFLVREEIGASSISFVELPKISQQVKEEPQFAQEQEKEKEKEPEIKLDLKRGSKKVYSFAKSADTRLTKNMRNKIDDLVKWMKLNPDSEIRVVGHSDNMGTTIEQAQRATKRSEGVLRYMQAKGIKKGRILIHSEGARSPIADPKTEAGRRKNRRVEIEVVKLR
jgi:outer membrane protein OmpA-like peptidoglycan-associated protein